MGDSSSVDVKDNGNVDEWAQIKKALWALFCISHVWPIFIGIIFEDALEKHIKGVKRLSIMAALATGVIYCCVLFVGALMYFSEI